jgi:deoxyribodipyrimidine photo-lyase
MAARSDRPALVWFRKDLRLADNPALRHALETHRAVIPVFVWAPEEEAPWAPGAASRWWLHQSLRSLEQELARRGSRLVVRRGPTANELQKLAEESGADAVFWNRRYEPAVTARDGELQQRLGASGLAAESFPGNLLFEPWTIRNHADKPFRVFTAFWHACLAAPAPSQPLAAPARIPPPKNWPASLAVSALGLEPAIDWAGGLREAWRPGEAGAAAQLDVFLAGALADYSAGRDRPGRRGTSRLSPHLHFGEIGSRQVWHAARRMGDSAAPYLRQIVWREFAHHLLFHFPDTPRQPLRPEFRDFPWRFDAAKLRAWTTGRTGYPLVDAGMRELWHTGWMHNRVRMVTASFLVKHLLVPWQEGAAWFWDTLVDADLADNTLGWQWTSGCGADAAPWFRIFNPVLQGEKFDPEGAYVRRWVPELGRLPEKWIHRPWQAPRAVLAAAGVVLGKTYPAPLVDHATARRGALAAFSSTRRPAL